ncbi:MAG: GNAT family N-acetyltransferase [Candidatus Paceibacterota bacterium]|jgi:GNAT superfamily N-acetyltransferase
MKTTNTYKINTGVSIENYKTLIFNLYKNYPNVAKSKVQEFEKTFSLNNPFFKYGKVENYFIFDDSQVVGHIAVIIDERFDDKGIVGFFECENRREYADQLFDKASIFLKNAGKKQYRGPINISVWQNFRVSFPEDNQPFCLEPFTLGYYRDLFLNNGFDVGHQNITTTESIEKTKIKDYNSFYSKSINDGYSYQLLSEENFKESIGDIYSLTSKIFEGSYSFYKISEEEFLYFAEQYTQIPKPYYVFLLKNSEHKSVGFFFAMPDIFNLNEKSLVLKTIGLLPEYQGKNLGSAMLYFVYMKAEKDGFKKFIFSTMSVDNERIKSITDQNSVPYRKYEVFEKNLI